MIGATVAANNVPLENNAAKPAVIAAPFNKTAHSSAPVKAPLKSAKPRWTDLTPAQQLALAPLASDWDKQDSLHKKKWLVLAHKYPSMKPEEQLRVQERMRDWVKLTPEQRRAARESYARAKKLNPDQKSAKWQQYQSLPEEQKKKLAADAQNKKRVANLPRAVLNKNRPPVKSASKLLGPAVASSPAVPAVVTATPPQPAAQTPTQLPTK